MVVVFSIRLPRGGAEVPVAFIEVGGGASIDIVGAVDGEAVKGEAVDPGVLAGLVVHPAQRHLVVVVHASR